MLGIPAYWKRMESGLPNPTVSPHVGVLSFLPEELSFSFSYNNQDQG